MSSRIIFVVLLPFILCTDGCSMVTNFVRQGASKPTSPIDQELNASLDKFCPLPSNSIDFHILRAKIVLAAIAGYAYRSINRYSGQSDAQDDASRAIHKINLAAAAIKTTNTEATKMLYPVYRVDMIIELGDAASAALQPTLRSGTKFIGALSSPSLDQALQLKKILISFLEDVLYLDAFNQSCADLKKPGKNGAPSQDDETDVVNRINYRCGDLAKIAGGAAQCSISF